MLKKILGFLALALFIQTGFAQPTKVLTAKFSGIISPASAEYISQAINKANSGKYDLFVLELDTPGGLDSSMRNIIKGILSSEVPVVTYVSPAGGRSASAGVFITMASDVAAMALETNIGAAHPVKIGAPTADKEQKKVTVEEEKIINDITAYMRSIVESKGRNTEWAIQAIEKSQSVTAEEAVKLKVVDFIAKDTGELLEKLNGFETKRFGKLKVENPVIEEYKISRSQSFLAVISDPNIALFLMSLGAAGIFIEMYNPGLILPGIVGVISLLLGLYSFNTMSANFAAIALILVSFICFIAEIKVASYGLLTAGGVISFVLGSVMLYSGDATIGIGVATHMIISILGPLLLIVAGLAYIFYRAHTHKITTGKESMVGSEIILTEDLKPKGKIAFDGEYWDAVSLEGNLKKGETVTVAGVEGFILKVKPK